MSHHANDLQWRMLARNKKLQNANVCLKQEIKECSRKTRAMAADECRLRAIVDSIDEQGFELNRQGKVMGTWGQNSRTVRCPKFFVGKSIGAYWGAKALRDIRPVLARVVESGKGENWVHMQERAGSQRWYDSRLTAIRTPAGRVSNVCLFSRDITDRKLLEGRVAYAEAIGSTTDDIFHKFNNILGLIRGTGELLTLNLGTAHPQYKYVSQLLRSTENAIALSRQLLALSRKPARNPDFPD